MNYFEFLALFIVLGALWRPLLGLTWPFVSTLNPASTLPASVANFFYKRRTARLAVGLLITGAAIFFAGQPWWLAILGSIAIVMLFWNQPHGVMLSGPTGPIGRTDMYWKAVQALTGAGETKTVGTYVLYQFFRYMLPGALAFAPFTAIGTLVGLTAGAFVSLVYLTTYEELGTNPKLYTFLPELLSGGFVTGILFAAASRTPLF